MEEIIKIVGIGVIALIIIIIMKQYRPEFAIYISIIAGLLIIWLVFGRLSEVINLIETITSKTKINNQYLGIILKITGIAILTEFAVSICKDSGESSIANKIEMGSKIVIISMSIPIISSLLEVMIKILPWERKTNEKKDNKHNNYDNINDNYK